MVTDLTKGNPDKTLWKFTLPMIISVMFQQLYSTVDSIVAGQFAGVNALAAVGASYPITMLFIAVANGSNIGCSVVISQLFGGKRITHMKTAVNTSIIWSLALLALYVWVAIKSLFYVLVYQVAYDNPNLSSKEVVEESEKLMTGNRGKYFVLQLSFIGWAILACLTFGIGFLWLTPYITISTICFYEALAGKSDSPIEVDSEEVE